MNPLLLNVILQETPAFIALIKSVFATKHPDQPEPTSEDVLAIFDKAFADSIAIDNAILSAPPSTP